MAEIPETQFATIGNDRIAYQVIGDGPIDLIYSVGPWGHLDVEWEDPNVVRFIRRLASFCRVIRFNARGSGLSDPRPPDGRTWDVVWAEDLLAVLNAADSEKAAVMDTSASSAFLVIPFAVKHPNRVTKLILQTPAAHLIREPGYPEGLPRETMERFLGFTSRHWGTEKWSIANCPSLANKPRAARWYAKWQRATSSPKIAADNFRLHLELDVRNLLDKVQTSTLVIVRSHCKWIPPELGRYVAGRIRDARLVEVPGSDGPPFWETPELVLSHIEEFLTGVRSGGEAERSLVAVLFTDIVDSTKRAAELGDQSWRELLDRHDEIQRQQVGLYKGHIVDSAGDGTFATFGRPDHAIDCAQALIAALVEEDVQIRVGIHFGDVELRDDGRVGGMTAHIGARLLALAQPGEILVSNVVQGILIGSRVKFCSRGVHQLKGVPGEWPLFALGQ